MLICNTIIVITDCRIASCIAYCLDALDTVRIKCIFVVYDCVETDDISFL